MKGIFCFFLIFTFQSTTFSQETKPDNSYHKKGSFAFHWGYNRSYYSKTNLHFTGPLYDFTVYDVKASDRQSKFGLVYFNPTTITIPQYTIRLAYYLTDRFAVSAGLEHMKYVVNANQMTTISGVVTPAASEKYAGSYLNYPIQLTPDLLTFKHTNGFNVSTIEIEYLQPLFYLRKPKLRCYWNTGAGGFWVVTKTDVRVFEDGQDNKFHVSGYTFTVKTGPRLEFRNLFYLAAEIKSGFASLPDVLIKNEAPEVGDHTVSFFEYYIAVGVNINKRKKAKNN